MKYFVDSPLLFLLDSEPVVNTLKPNVSVEASMKRLLVVSTSMVSLVALASTAAAADLSRRYPPPPPPAVVPVYTLAHTWTGFYIGVNGGAAFGHSNWDTAAGFNLTGGLIGGTVGYNWQPGGPLVLGFESDLDWSGINGTTTALCPLGCKTANTWLGTVRGRVGYAIDRIMPYVTGGLAFGNIKATTPGFPGVDNTNTGWTVGAGLEVAIGGGWTAKAEYLFVDLGNTNCGLSCGVFPNDNVSYRTSIVRGGLNYHF
jgi:outer membrane immunogenic protein